MMKRLRVLPMVTILYLAAVYLVRYMNGSDPVLSLIDTLFIVGISYASVAALMFVFQNGFLNGILYAFKRFRAKSKKDQYVAQFDDIEERKEIHEVYTVKEPFRLTAPLFYIGFLSLAVSLILSYSLYT
ncbi:DUF3899 domain-containing protein [Rossellomorea marisflavi]|uniref:DUF3899 domain-containing protein n=1 Tax=Rossellomorea marisflavi TaxID=189381 RepID=UPI00345B0525